ncbi:MAG: hypothetical protein ACC608_06595 [Anaerofustis sp.]
MLNTDLIKKFRNKVNGNHYFILHKYRNFEQKNKWNCICSAMDWITVSVEYFSDHYYTSQSKNLSSIDVFTYIMCIDIVWESITQLYRVLYNTRERPFQNDTDIFLNKIYEQSDNAYFKTIRACFGAHAVNLDHENNDPTSHRYASWSSERHGTSEGDFTVILYSNETIKNDLYLNIKFEELNQFLITRYNLLDEIMTEIDKQYYNYSNETITKKIPKDNDSIKQLKILAEISKQRLNAEYYNYEIKRLRIIFESEISNKENFNIVEKFRKNMAPAITEIYDGLQNMTYKSITVTDCLDDIIPFKHHYVFSKISDHIFGDSTAGILIGLKDIISDVADSVNILGTENYPELYLLILTGFYFKN